MKTYICRLVNYDGVVLDGAFVTANNKREALKKRMKKENNYEKRFSSKPTKIY